MSSNTVENRNHECRKVASLTLAIAIADVMTGFTWPIKFLGNKLLCGRNRVCPCETKSP